MELDIRTLLFVSGVVLFSQTLAFSYLSTSGKSYAGTREWIYGILAISLGCFAMFIRGYEFLYLASILLSNLFFVSGLIFLYKGSKKFMGLKADQNLPWLLLGIYMVIIVNFSFINNQLWFRIIIFSVTSSLLLFLNGRNFLKHHQANYRKPAIFMAFLFLIPSLFYFIRVLYHIQNRELDSIFSNNIIQNINFILPLVMGILWTFVMIIIINQRLNGELKEQAIELEKMNNEKERIFSIIAHDLRGPFASILSLSNVIADKSFKLNPDQYAELASSIEKTAHSTNNLLENLLEWSGIRRRTRPYSFQKYQFAQATGSTIENLSELAEGKNILLRNLIDDQLEFVADLNMFQTLIRNLVSNAIKFTPTGGTIVLEASTQNDGSTLFSVSDNGIGMPDALLTSIFEFKAHNNRPGTNGEPSSGLGLQLCHEIVKAHLGKIWVESKEQQGSTFYFQINLPE